MLSSLYAEDIFLEFYSLMSRGDFIIENRDAEPIESFYSAIVSNKQLTKSQANFIIRLLSKYINDIEEKIEGVKETIENPRWKNSFREIDNSKKVSLHIDENHIQYLLIKFPFSFKETYTKEFIGNIRSISVWDVELKAQKVRLLDVNLVSFVDIAKKHRFEIDSNIVDAVETIEEYWNDQTDYIPHCVVEDSQVVLKNATESGLTFFESNRTGQIDKDLFLAKTLGHVAHGREPLTFLDKIVSSEENKFWIKTTESLLNLIKKIDNWPVIIILDRATDTIKWSNEFIEAINETGNHDLKTKICFRFPNSDAKGSAFNQWIKDHGYGAELKEGQIFICNHKPPKWMFKDNFDAKILVSNGIYPSTNTITESMCDSHHTVFFLGDIKPSEKRKKKIVEL
jgi:hypothetical protein